MAQVITLTTDFGWRDSYVAAMKGSILALNPQATIGSSGYLEVAAKNGSAAQRLGLGVNTPVIIKKL